MVQNQFVYQMVAEYVGKRPSGVGRSAVAARFNVTKTTAQAHLEKCVQRGLLVKFYSWLDRNHRGWVYTTPQNQPTFEGIEVHHGSQE